MIFQKNLKDVSNYIINSKASLLQTLSNHVLFYPTPIIFSSIRKFNSSAETNESNSWILILGSVITNILNRLFLNIAIIFTIFSTSLICIFWEHLQKNLYIIINKFAFIIKYSWTISIFFFLILTLYLIIAKIIILDFQHLDPFRLKYFIIIVINSIIIGINIILFYALFNFFTLNENVLIIDQIIHLKRIIPFGLQQIYYEKAFYVFCSINDLTPTEIIFLLNWKYTNIKMWSNVLITGCAGCSSIWALWAKALIDFRTKCSKDNESEYIFDVKSADTPIQNIDFSLIIPIEVDKFQFTLIFFCLALVIIFLLSSILAKVPVILREDQENLIEKKKAENSEKQLKIQRLKTRQQKINKI